MIKESIAVLISVLLVPITIGADFSQQDITAENVLGELNGIKDDSYSVDLTGLDTPRSYGSSDWERIEIVLHYKDADGYNVDIWCPPHNYLSAYNVLKVASGTTVEVAHRLFANPKIDFIHVMQQMDVGLDDPIKAIQIEVSRETYESIDWDDAKERIKEDPEAAFEIFGPCNINVKGSSGYKRPAQWPYNC
jgi:hypothetical protein